ncbi:hypothetical protein Btru_059081 [Bulinus truncatus]|nr:hypothetical protein Btru_059081 [Bulinus truncatus]
MGIGVKPMARVVKPMARVVKPMARGVKPMARGVKPMARGVKPMARVVKPMSRVVKPMARGVKPMGIGVSHTNGYRSVSICRFEQAGSSDVCMAPNKDSTKRATVERPGGQKIENQRLQDEQMELLREKAKLEEQAKFWREALHTMQHCCDDCDTLLTSSCSRHHAPADYIDMTQEEEDEDVTIVEEDQFVGGPPAAVDEEEDEMAALDLSLKTSAALAEESYRSALINDCSLSEYAMPYDVNEEDGSTLDLGATQEVELNVHKRGKKSKKRVTFSDSVGKGKKLKSDIFTPPMCTTVC